MDGRTVLSNGERVSLDLQIARAGVRLTISRYRRLLRITLQCDFNHVTYSGNPAELGQMTDRLGTLCHLGVTSITNPRDSIHGVSPLPLAFLPPN
jgi:hypothetical protein